MDAKQWTVDISIDEHERQTRSTARLRTQDTTVVGVGLARRNPSDRNVPEIGDELATARALADLSHQLIDATVNDIEGITHAPVHLTE
ncbi:DUF1876 domain-containing protein [Rhodococcus spongiicola]|uniref:DUF1876 domain-containing protein n=1 Tax=Rhodococcus spongiicola TaxID=2487352 RepID=A0A3S3AF86_9NOCA|nr:DUF1876 domain-containing protein [Rhodococcus spongiicola]RVW03291.1 DUF1876 domain-containing protein [Rhodococcus spongiicola]